MSRGKVEADAVLRDDGALVHHDIDLLLLAVALVRSIVVVVVVRLVVLEKEVLALLPEVRHLRAGAETASANSGSERLV